MKRLPTPLPEIDTMPLTLDEFALLPRLTGVWHGDFQCLDTEGREIKRYACVVTQRIEAGRWVQSNENTYEDGRADLWRFLGHAFAPGVMRLTSPDAPYDTFRMTATEAAPHVLLLDVRLARTGAVLATETFTLIDPARRVRTIQQFDAETGNLRGYMLVRERRVAA
jgi:hypothetical protein